VCAASCDKLCLFVCAAHCDGAFPLAASERALLDKYFERSELAFTA